MLAVAMLFSSIVPLMAAAAATASGPLPFKPLRIHLALAEHPDEMVVMWATLEDPGVRPCVELMLGAEPAEAPQEGMTQRPQQRHHRQLRAALKGLPALHLPSFDAEEQGGAEEAPDPDHHHHHRHDHDIKHEHAQLFCGSSRDFVEPSTGKVSQVGTAERERAASPVTHLPKS